MDQASDKLLDKFCRAIATALIGAGASMLSFAGVRAQTGPLVIAKQGYFFVGGTIDSTPRRLADGRATCMWNTRCRSGSRIPIRW